MDSMHGDSNIGFAYVILGRPSFRNATLSLTMWNPAMPSYLPPGVIQIEGEHAYDYFGRSVGTVDDFDEVGYDDVIVGAPREWDPDRTDREGRANIFAGREMDNNGFIHIFANEAGETFVAEDPLHYFGRLLEGFIGVRKSFLMFS